MSDAQNTGSEAVGDPRPMRLRDALRQARIEAADRTGVVVELRDAEVARLEILNEALDPLFAQIPDRVDLFDRGISQGETPRLWIDVVAHVVMGRDKRIYRLCRIPGSAASCSPNPMMSLRSSMPSPTMSRAA